MTARDSGGSALSPPLGRFVILVATDRAVAGIVLYLAQDSPGFTILESSADWGPWPHAGPVCIQKFMETPHID